MDTNRESHRGPRVYGDLPGADGHTGRMDDARLRADRQTDGGGLRHSHRGRPGGRDAGCRLCGPDERAGSGRDRRGPELFWFDLPIEDAHGNLRIVLNHSGSIHVIESSSVTGTALGGRLDGKVQVRGGARYELDTQLRIDDGKLDELSRSLGFQKIIGTGKLVALA